MGRGLPQCDVLDPVHVVRISGYLNLKTFLAETQNRRKDLQYAATICPVDVTRCRK